MPWLKVKFIDTVIASSLSWFCSLAPQSSGLYLGCNNGKDKRGKYSVLIGETQWLVKFEENAFRITFCDCNIRKMPCLTVFQTVLERK